MPPRGILLSKLDKAAKASIKFPINSDRVISPSVFSNNNCDKWRQRTIGSFSSKHGPFAKLCRGLEEFFENGQSLPKQYVDKNVEPENYGRAWSTLELRGKSFEDLHQLWYICLKELNLLATQECECQKYGKPFFGRVRRATVRLTMARIKTILSQRSSSYWAEWTRNEQKKIVSSQIAGSETPSPEQQQTISEETKEVFEQTKDLINHVQIAKTYRKNRQMMRGFRRRISVFGIH